MAADGLTKLITELMVDSTSWSKFFGTDGPKQVEDFAKNAQQSIGGMENPLKKITGIFDSFQGLTLGAAGAIAGTAVAIGAMVKVGNDAVDSTVEFGKEMRHLEHFMGGTAQQAGELAMALFRVGISADEYIGYMTKEVKNLDKVIQNHQDLKPLLLDESGHYQNLAVVHQVLIDKYISYTGEIDRNKFAIENWGRSGPKAVEVMEKVAKAVEANRIVLKDMDIDYKEVEQSTLAYIKAKRDEKVIEEAQSIMIGTTLLPTWTSMKMSMNDVAKDVMPSVVWIFQVFASAVVILIGLLKTLWNDIRLIMDPILVLIMSVSKALERFWKGDFAGAGAALKDSMKEMKDAVDRAVQDNIKAAEEGSKRLNQIWHPKKSESEAGLGGNNEGPKDKESALDRVKAALEKEKFLYEAAGIYKLDANGKILGQKAAQDQEYRVYSKEMEAKFLQSSLDAFEGDGKQRAKLEKLVFEARRALMNEGWKDQLADYDKRIKLETQSTEKAIQMAIQKRDAIAKYNGGNTKTAEWEKADQEVQQLEKKREDLLKEISQLRGQQMVDLVVAQEDHKIKIIQQGVQNGILSEERGLIETFKIEEGKYAIQRNWLEKRIALKKLEGDAGLKEAANLEAQLQKLDEQASSRRLVTQQKLAAEMRQHNPMAGLLEGGRAYVKAAENLFENFKGAITDILKGIESGFANAISGMIKGQMTFGEAMKSIWGSIVDVVAGAIAKLIAQWAVASVAAMIFKTETVVGENVKAAASLDTAAAETWAAYSWMPFVGPGIAMAQIAAMDAAYVASKAAHKAITPFATGGLVDGPRLGLVGEAGPEYIVPDKDMKTLLPSLVDAGARIYGAIAASRAMGGKASRFGQAAPALNQTRNTQGHTFNISGVIGDKRQLGAYLKNVINDHTLRYGSAI